ncbi:holo-ACP synthase [Filibacter tadaridae]|uniref:Holo-[acyl-carrier-protein] synthase n=1 Tax=Filibacter tadaridae TaxID=2483811 RepID=A0A3P5WVE0_9BACL|nr:holo-ACP synthase [Filibacter tadaridae]VDC19957.1 Holo-[acyl-carrier-protein] synthase [Filibacter tadaridae]
MISGIGLDIVELDRIAKLNSDSSAFRQRILTQKELFLFESLKGHRQTEFLAGRFAVKEAYSKANGTGIGSECNLTDIEVLPDEFGKPVLYFKGELANGFVSITHSKTVAAAQVILLA